MLFRSEGKNPKGGLNEKGRESYNRETGGNLKAPVKSGTNPRRVSFAARFAGMKGPMEKPNGEPTRNWLHVEDTAKAIIHIINSGQVNTIFNICGNYEDKNINILEKIIHCYFGKKAPLKEYIDFDYSRPGQDIRYGINDDKLKSLGWKPIANFDKEIKQIVKYYKNNFIW